ncbi:hypothetical protein Q664_27270 [Archangium violaceum Cb vi76]|uniref:Serine protease n=1 Tax=Archangium violaceum Cb vi76 TaxID=1406225 RepID=A0A084SQ33_9BACT|nr:hypothetical protein Q664_27270 [Archangium violaceum Cb vi76]
MPPHAYSVSVVSFVVAIDGFEAREQQPGSRGSAIIVGPHHLLTCWHVVQRREGAPWGQPDALAGEPWARLGLVHLPEAAPLECVGHDPSLDLALLYSPTELRAPVARWLDAASLHGWLRNPSPWVALGCSERTRQPSSHHGTGWLGENRDYLQLQGGIPAGFSGGALMPEHQELCAGVIQLGGKKSPLSVALSAETIERFLWQFKGRDAIELIRVPGPALARQPPGPGLRANSRGKILAVTGMIVSVLGGLATAWGIQRSRASQKPAPPVSLPVEQTTNVYSTTGAGSPIIKNDGTLNLTINTDDASHSK